MCVRARARARACVACVRACVRVYIQDLAVKLLIVFEKFDDGGHNVLISLVGGGGRGGEEGGGGSEWRLRNNCLYASVRKLQPVLENKVCKHGYLCRDTNSTFSDQVFQSLAAALPSRCRFCSCCFVHPSVAVMFIIIVHSFYIALFAALQLTHCAHVACDSE